MLMQFHLIDVKFRCRSCKVLRNLSSRRDGSMMGLVQPWSGSDLRRPQRAAEDGHGQQALHGWDGVLSRGNWLAEAPSR